jgi:hypothetical protein
LLSSPEEEAVVAAVGGGTTLDAISIDDRDALDDVKSGERLTRLGLVLAIAAEGSCGIEDEAFATPVEEDDDDDDDGKTSSSRAIGRIAVDKLSMICRRGEGGPRV